MKTCLDCTVLPPFSIVLCPLHAAAEDLVAALRAVMDHVTHCLGNNPHGRCVECQHSPHPFVAARAALALAVTAERSEDASTGAVARATGKAGGDD